MAFIRLLAKNLKQAESVVDYKEPDFRQSYFPPSTVPQTVEGIYIV
ncbi:TPA: hypothetical protein TXJ06_001888 [Streptococcus suis]|nr:hypothetical protein [Streptococcus suis]